MKEKLKEMLKAQNVIKLILLLLIVNCSLKRTTIEKFSNEYEVLNHILKNSNGNIYYKTIVKDGEVPIESYVKDEFLEFYLCGSEVDSPVKIDKKSINLLKENFKKLRVERLDKLFPLLANRVVKKKVRLKTSFITVPALFKNNTMAIYYSTQTYGGEFKLLKKINGKWKTICSNSVWIE